MRGLTAFIPEQDIDGRLLSAEGERVIDLVRKHWIVYWRSLVAFFLAFLLFVYAFVVPVEVGWLFLLGSAASIVYGFYVTAREHRDIFVITNLRVFRASGVFSIKVATMPISRILDITVDKPLLGRFLGYGHFIFESAAQAQGLRDIRFISDPSERDLIIQRTIQEAGLR